jgi:hypothetical protein
MTTRILFNGKDYPSVEAMPDDVRKLYQQAIAQLADTDHDGIPDVLQGRGDAAKTVIGIQSSSITVNGKTYGSIDDMPPLVRVLFDQVIRQVGRTMMNAADVPSASGSLPEKPRGELAVNPDRGLPRALDQTETFLRTLLLILLSAAAGAVIVFGSWMMTHMSASERSQGGAVYVGIGMAVVLGAIAVQLAKLWMRRQRSGS